MAKGWFDHKTIGFGIGPRSWEDWLVTALFVAGLLILVKIAPPDLSPFLGLTPPVLRIAFGGVWIIGFLVLIWTIYDPEV